jgi:hypothetical protein
MPQPIAPDIERRKIDFGMTAEDLSPEPQAPQMALLADLGLPWPPGQAPRPQPWGPTDAPSPDDPMPRADVLVVTWTVAEHEALADVLTPGYPRNTWARYARRFEEHYRPLIRAGAPAMKVRRLGSYFRTEIAGTTIICVKSELHLNQDGVTTAPGKATLPVKDFFRQMIEEVQPRLVITVGTAGATFPPGKTTDIGGMTCSPHELGDVIITRGAKFRLQREFANESFAHATYKCETFAIPTHRLDAAKALLKLHASKLTEPAFGPPSAKYQNPAPTPGFKNEPDFKIDGRDFPAFHPILTTDFFEFGNSVNGLEMEGSGVEMGDAVLGMVVEEMKGEGKTAPDWLVIRNASDPQINGLLPNRDTPGIDRELRRALDMQAHWAVWYYETYGYWTSVSSAIAVWAMVE